MWKWRKKVVRTPLLELERTKENLLTFPQATEIDLLAVQTLIIFLQQSLRNFDFLRELQCFR